ncbi:MAG: tRNA lysidine(34) synthetase TilS [Mucinivorans sp.]
MTLNDNLFKRGDSVLAAVSGGADSMVLLYLLVVNAERLGLARLAVAHCNFSLRGPESDSETELVGRVCAEYGVECFVEQYDTHAVCRATGESTQMAARRLRYDFFERLCAQHNFNRVAVAHHAGDTVETFFINLTRGTGLRGLTGINEQRDKIVRPLLGVGRDEIERFASENSIPYLNDSSNATLDYLRNRLRLDIIPRIDHSVPDFFGAMARTIENLEQTQTFIDEQIESIRCRVLVDDILDLDAVRAMPSSDFVLYELLHAYGFSTSTIHDIAQVRQTGKEFFSPTHRAILDRGRLVIGDRQKIVFHERQLTEDDPAIEWMTVDELFSLDTPSNVALLSADAMQFPLTLRHILAGDWFVPLGLKGQKKVSDFLIDRKVSVPDKERQGVLVSGTDTIVWLVGQRIDERFRVTEATRRVARITL